MKKKSSKLSSASAAAANKGYSLEELLEKQNNYCKNHELWPLLLQHYRANARLRTIRLRKNCYQVMSRGRVSESNVPHFIRTYKLPNDPFFSIYFQIKRAQIVYKKERAQERVKKIALLMRKLPPNINHFIIFLAHLEQIQNEAYPLWKSFFFPRTIKQARELNQFTLPQWQAYFREYLDELFKKHAQLPFNNIDRLLSCMLLDCPPDVHLRRWPTNEEIKEAFRALSKLHHPDAGGDPEYFKAISEARMLFMSSSIY